jgi:hypothetical protein
MALSFASLWWAVILFWGGADTQHVFVHYHLMHEIMPFVWWTSLFAAHGVVSLLGLLSFSKNRLFFIFDNILGTMLWTGTLTLILVTHYTQGEVPPAFLASHLVLAIFSWWIMVRNKYDS